MALAVNDPDRVRELLKQGEPVTAPALLAAIQSNTIAPNQNYENVFKETEESLALLLAAGTDPNLRLDSADGNLSGVKEGWATGDPSTEREFLCSWREMYPLHWAGTGHVISQHREKQHLAELQKLLLAHGADPYALFRQPLRPRQPFFLFPGVVESKDPVEDELGYSAIDGFESMEAEEHSKYNAYKINRDAAAIAEAKERGDDYDDDDETAYRSEASMTPEEYGARSLIHAMLEDGALVKPILDLPDLDIERKDPQGRTLLLSACRSALGADAAIDGFMGETYWDVHTGTYFHNPFPQQPSRIRATSMTTGTTTVLQYFITKGADILAVDNYGKHAIFHLLESHNAKSDAPWVSFISHSLRTLMQKVPQLVNQPDKAGNYPLHAAMRRLCRSMRTLYNKGFVSELYGVVHDLLAAGVDSKARDELGNTALHYLANEGLVKADSSEYQKRLFADFVNLGVDINARNKAGQTALELFVEDGGDGCPTLDWERDNGLAVEIMGFFESAGAFLDEKGPEGQSLLHLVAKQDSEKAAQMVKYLVQRGFDPKARDANGKTPIDLARECVPRRFHKTVLALLEG